MIELIASLFYPRKLRELVEDLRKKGALNERAFSELNYFIGTYALFFLGFLVTFLVVSLLYPIVPGLSAIVVVSGVIIFIFIKNFISRMCNEFLFVYSNSHLGTEGVVRGYYYYDSSKTKMGRLSYKAQKISFWNLSYEYWVDGIVYDGELRGIPISLHEKHFFVGEKLKIIYDPRNPKKSAPLLSTLSSVFKLTK